MRSKLRRVMLTILDAYYRLGLKAFVPFVLVALVAPALRLFAALGPQRACQQLYVCSAAVEHPVAGWVVAIAVLLIPFALYGVGWRAHNWLNPSKVQTSLITKDMSLSEFDLGNEPLAFYYPPPEFDRTVSTVTAIAKAFGKGDRPNDFGVVIRGPAKIGKTRFAIEVLKRATAGYRLLKWRVSFHPRLDPSEYELLAGERLVLFIDDLPDEVSDPINIGALRDAIGRLRHNCKSFVVVATFRTPNELAETDLVRILEHLPSIDLKPMDRDSVAGQEFVGKLKSYLEDIGRSPKGVDPNQFDGFPGSALLGLDWVKALVPTIPPNDQKILQAMALLRRVGVNVYPEKRLRRVAAGIFGLNLKKWQEASNNLLRYELVQRLPTSAGAFVLKVRNDNYLDECLGAIFPEPSRTVEEYYPELLAALGGDDGEPPDADALFDMSDALRGSGAGDAAWRAEVALRSARAGLKVLDKDRSAEQWARGQTLLALALVNSRLSGSAEANHLAAADAFSEALTRLGQTIVPVQWANTIHDRGAVRSELGRLAIQRGDYAGCQVHKAAALRDLRAALQVFVPDKYPNDYAAIDQEIRRVEEALCS